jgi:hypothetical protein
MTALTYAREGGKEECIKVLETALLKVPFDRVMFSLHCSMVVQEDMVGESSSPLREFCTNERYRHLLEHMLGMMMME